MPLPKEASNKLRKGKAEVWRYADDFVCMIQYQHDARYIERALRERFTQFDLELHPEKTRVISFGRYLQRISDGLGPAPGGKLGDGLRAVYFESAEINRANWTADFPEQYSKRRGYRLDPYLPFVLENNAPEGDTPRADALRRVRYGFHRTLVELIPEASYRQYTERCRSQGLQSRTQRYGSPEVHDTIGMAMTADRWWSVKRLPTAEEFFFCNSHRRQTVQFESQFATGEKTSWA